ncbi:MAG: 4-oxalocrotonate tautomerase [Rhodospirillales bacterium]|jgi:4-oxalocrotonate tautomerase family enzyme|nr:4-oxalocrotonate tautomerase [Rhodospirillales bacterium]
MPIVTIQQFAGRSEDQKTELARRITAAIRDVYGKTAQPVQVVFHEIGADGWYSEAIPVRTLPRDVG